MRNSRFSLVTYFVHSSVHRSISVSQSTPPTSRQLGIQTFVLYIYVSISALQIGSSAWYFYIPHICVNIKCFPSLLLNGALVVNCVSGHLPSASSLLHSPLCCEGKTGELARLLLRKTHLGELICDISSKHI